MTPQPSVDEIPETRESAIGHARKCGEKPEDGKNDEGRHRLVVARQSVGEDRNEEKQPGGQSERREQNLVAGEQGAEKDAEEAEQRQQIEQRPRLGS